MYLTPKLSINPGSAGSSVLLNTPISLYGWVFVSSVGHKSNDQKTMCVSLSRLTRKPTLLQHINTGRVSFEFGSLFIIKMNNMFSRKSVIAKNPPVHPDHYFYSRSSSPAFFKISTIDRLSALPEMHFFYL